MINYLDENIFKSDEDKCFDFDKYRINIELKIDLSEETDVTKSKDSSK